MMEFFRSGGVMMWPLLMIGAVIVAVSVRAAIRIRSSSGSRSTSEELQAIVFWGAVGLAIGAMGTVVGIWQMASVLAGAASASSALIWGGISVTMPTLIIGLLLFIGALITWYAMRAWSLRQG